MSLRGLARLAACAVVALAVACIDITVSGSDLGSLRFVPLPYPSVDAGDTLRDANDVAAPLQGIAYRADDTEDPQVVITFVALDSGVTIDSATRFLRGNVLPAAKVSDTVRLIASAVGLQTASQRLFVVPKADTIASGTALQAETIRYSLPATSSDASTALVVKIGKKGGTTEAPTLTPSQGYIVRYRLKKGTTTIPANDTLGAFSFVESAGGRLSSVDTTDNTGQASRSLQFRIRAGQATVDTVTVVAEAKRGGRLTTEIQWTVVVKPKSAS